MGHIKRSTQIVGSMIVGLLSLTSLAARADGDTATPTAPPAGSGASSTAATSTTSTPTPAGKTTAPTSPTVAANGTITFDEYSLGTYITNQYRSSGVRFDSTVFTTNDLGNPTAPVLSGSPKFQGPIVFTIVDPATGNQATANGITLDVGYIDSPNSVQITYFDATGATLGSTRANGFGINHIALALRGIAKVRVETVSTEPAGFAIDNLRINTVTGLKKPVRYAALGDSYTSGEGLLPQTPYVAYDCGTDLHNGSYYENSDAPYWGTGTCDTITKAGLPWNYIFRSPKTYENLCHRSPLAWPVTAATTMGISSDNFLFVACSGAVLANIGLNGVADATPQYPKSPNGVAGGNTQAVDLLNFANHHGDPDLITIGIGGNDLPFMDILTRCMSSEVCTDDGGFTAGIEYAAGPVVYNKLVETLQKLKGTYPAATILTYGYPSVIDRNNIGCLTNAWGGNVKLNQTEADWISGTVLPELNQTIADAAATAGVTFMPITDVTKGHEICSNDPWINALQLGNDQMTGDHWYDQQWIGDESFHPNQKAHAAIAKYFADHYLDANGNLLFSNPAPNDALRDFYPYASMVIGQTNVTGQTTCGLDCLQPGCSVSSCSMYLNLSGYSPNTPLTVTIHSDPVVLGTVTTDANGNYTGSLPVPASVPPGIHTVDIHGTDTGGNIQSGFSYFGFSRAPTIIPLTPIRVFDTRPSEAQGAVTVTKQRVGGDANILHVKLAGVAGVPVTGAVAVSLNVTAVSPDGPGYVTAFPCGDRPLAANLTYVAGQIVPNAVIAPLSTTGEVCFYSYANTDLVADVNGWFATGAGFAAIRPNRLFDTRPTEAQGAAQVAKQRVGGDANILHVKVTGVGGVPAGGVGAVSLNVTAVSPSGPGYVTVFPCGGSRPLAANLTYVAGQIVPNAVVAPVAADGTVCFYSYASTDLVADVNGWFAAPPGFTSMTPVRLFDTRTTEAQGAVTVPKTKIGGDAHILSVKVAGAAGVPVGAAAVSLNVTAVNPDGPGYLTVYPCGGSRPLAANLTYVAGQIVPNAVVAPVAADGTICVYSYAPSDVVADLNGWFAAAG